MNRPTSGRSRQTATDDNSANRAIWAAWAAEDRKARNIVVLDLSPISPLADYFLICSATSGRQVKAIADHIDETLSKRGARLAHAEGFEELSWVLLDYGDLVVHIFTEEARDYYQLERFWIDAEKLSVPARPDDGVTESERTSLSPPSV